MIFSSTKNKKNEKNTKSNMLHVSHRFYKKFKSIITTKVFPKVLKFCKSRNLIEILKNVL